MNQDLETYRNAARRLKKAYAAGAAEAVARVNAHVPADRPPRHADFLHVIAREAGEASWPQLKFALDTLTQSRDHRAERLKIALYEGQHWRIERLLAQDPGLAAHNLGLQIALYDQRGVEAALARDPSAATRVIGVRTPLLHLAFSKEIHRSPEKRAAMMAIAAALVAHGADVNEGYPAEPGSDHKLSALYGALCHAGNTELGRWLLEHGADPNDNECAYHATELGQLDTLRLLMKHGVRLSGTNALPRALDFRDLEMVRLLLDYGADPNEAVQGHPSGQPVDSVPALHQAARRWCPGEIATLLLDRGADPFALWGGHTPYATARIYGNPEIAAVLEARGAATALTEGEQLLADCAEGRRPAGPIAPDLLQPEDRLLLTRLVFEPDRLEHFKELVAAGLDPDQVDEMGLTPLHAAGWAGLREAVEFLLTLDPDLEWENGFGGDALGAVIHGSEHRLDRSERDHIGCARLLLEAGAKLPGAYIDDCGNEAMAAFLEEWRDGRAEARTG